jgi:protein-S-isoprenylcysteine O-methyltransferase Ste14
MNTRSASGEIFMLLFKLTLGSIMNLLIFGLLLFLPAGTLHWWRAWVFIGVIQAAYLAMAIWVFPKRPDLLDERFKPPIQKGQPLADQIILLLFIAAYCGLVIFISLDVFRLHWMGAPGPVMSSLGLIFVVDGLALLFLCFKENAFAAPVVRHQVERSHTVVDTGAYGMVRHPMYAGAALLMLGMSLWLESYAAAALSIVPIALLAVRIEIEERFLLKKLRGYDAYRERVRYRLIPFVW